MSWIAFDVNLPDKPKVRQMARYLGLDRDAVAGKLARVWGWFDQASEDGFIAGAVNADVDDLSRHNGFADAMALVGWLDISSDGLRIPEFDIHHGNSAKKRALGALRQARYRSRKSDAQSVTKTNSNAGDVTKLYTESQDSDVLVTKETLPQNITEHNKEKEQERAVETKKPPEPTSAGLACKAIMAAGIMANPSHPDLLAAIAEGATPQEFADAAAECKAKGKGFPYLLAMVRRRKAEAAAPVAKNPNSRREPTGAKPLYRREGRRATDPAKGAAHVADILKTIGIST